MTAFALRPSRLRPDVSVGAARVWLRNRDVFLRLWKSELSGMAIEPWLVIAAMGIGLGRFVELDGGEDYARFIGPGLLAVFPMFASAFECGWGSFVRLEMQHTYHAVIATPVSVDDVVTGDLLWGTTRGVMNASYILVVQLLLNPWLHMVESPWIVLGILPVATVLGLLFSSISIMFASVARAMSQFAYFFNLVIIPMFWFSGAFFPFDSLPDWARALGWFIPLTHAVDIYRGLASGDLAWSMLGDFAWLLVVTAVAYILALALMRRRLID
jgi:lipooligosaccharide transport system permease protein